jgi:2-polyprenyl-3-methyl-5-hydroxy-6-metoxy-1,4-benzoquinol methylase
MIHHNVCPFCNSGKIQQKFSAKDYTVSGELFAIFQCNECSGAFTQSVPDQQAIGPYYASDSYVSHSNTQKGAINKIYHVVRNITLKAKRKLLQQTTSKKAGSILDIGCGTGAFLDMMRKSNWQITGLEPDELARKNAAEIFDIHPLPSNDIFSLPSNNFDAITMWHVLEHVHQLHEYIEQIKSLLKNEGTFIVAVPNYTSYDAGHYQQFWAAYDVPRHLYHFSPESMKILMKKHGLEVVSTKPMWFDSFYVSMLSEEYRSGRGNIINAFVIGLISNLKALLKKEKCSSLVYIIKKSA